MLTTRQVILVDLLLRGPGTGAELQTRLREQFKGRAAINNGAVYPALRDMETGGLAELDGYKQPAFGIPAKRYRLTSQGRDAAEVERTLFMVFFKAEEQAEPEPVDTEAEEQAGRNVVLLLSRRTLTDTFTPEQLAAYKANRHVKAAPNAPLRPLHGSF